MIELPRREAAVLRLVLFVFGVFLQVLDRRYCVRQWQPLKLAVPSGGKEEGGSGWEGAL